LWPHPNPGDHDLYKLAFAVFQEAFTEISAFLALWFVRIRFLNDSTLFLHFCDHLLFEEDLALDLYNFKFPLPKEDLYQV
jgi:hypothetical protein